MKYIFSIKMKEEADIMNILEAEPSSDTDHRERLAVLAASGNAKKMTGVDLTQDQVKD